MESFDALTGTPQWQHAYPTAYRDDFGFDEGPRAVPVVSAGIVYTFGAEGKLYAVDLATVIGWMSTVPAALAGLVGKGAIAPGNDADLVVLAPDATFEVDPARLHHRNPLTPYAGSRLHGVVRRVFLGGRTVVADGEPVGDPTGRLLRRQA